MFVTDGKIITDSSGTIAVVFLLLAEFPSFVEKRGQNGS
jgi:hypothetical protein